MCVWLTDLILPYDDAFLLGNLWPVIQFVWFNQGRDGALLIWCNDCTKLEECYCLCDWPLYSNCSSSCLITCSNLAFRLAYFDSWQMFVSSSHWKIWCNCTVPHFCNSNLLSSAISTQKSQVNMERKIVCVGLCVLIKQIFILFGLHIIQCLADCLPCVVKIS